MTGGTVQLVVYLDGSPNRSTRVLRRLEELRRAAIAEVTLEVVDISVDPERAERDRVMATPVVHRRWPHPELRAVGEAPDIETIADVLGIAIHRPPDLHVVAEKE